MKGKINLKSSIAISYNSVLKSKWDCGIKKRKNRQMVIVQPREKWNRQANASRGSINYCRIVNLSIYEGQCTETKVRIIKGKNDGNY